MSKIIDSTYEPLKQIGSGGGGKVYLASHLRLNKKVVLKADKRKITTKSELLRREVDVLKDLSHTYIPKVYDYFIENDTVYTVMDYIEGESFDKPLKRGERFSQAQVIKWAKQLLSALSYLHSPTHGDPPRGFVHSDIKPANLMRTPYGDIRLIDFNIALALGEENFVGCSIGYASPEHYGLDYTSGFTSMSSANEKNAPPQNNSDARTDNSMTAPIGDDSTVPMTCDLTVPMKNEPEKIYREITLPLSQFSGGASGSKDLSRSASSPPLKKVVPDVRSDIYSVGATLYHLLSGTRPARNAVDVVPLSESEFSPQIIGIISKAMTPNPDLRYQTADEMLYDFEHLHENDPRRKRLKREFKITSAVLGVLFAAGIFSSFVGLKRNQTIQSWLKLSEYSKNALAQGNAASAVEYALMAVPERTGIFTPSPVPEALYALSSALGVYDLSDGFKTHKTLELPSEVLYMDISPDGNKGACVYSGKAAVFDTGSAEIIAELTADISALSEIHFLDDNTVIYASDEGIKAYDIQNGKNLWNGESAASISVSGNGERCAAVYKDNSFAVIYKTKTGEILYTVDFGGKKQSVSANDIFADPDNNIFSLNNEGNKLAASFSDGSLMVYDFERPDNDIQIFDENSGFTHFEGGFYNNYLAFSASNKDGSAFAVIDCEEKKQTGGFKSEDFYSVKTDKEGIYVQTGNILVKIDPITGDQKPLVNTPENIGEFAVCPDYTVISTKKGFKFFDRNAELMSGYDSDMTANLISITKNTALLGSYNSNSIRIMRYDDHPENDVFSYDPSYRHDEARISADGKNITLFSYKSFRVYDISGELVKEVDIPDAENVYDQQYLRNNGVSELEVTYYDGRKTYYSMKSGEITREETGPAPDKSLDMEFLTDNYRIEAPLHGSPEAYEKNSGKLAAVLNEDAYLTYVTQCGEYVIAQYVTAENYFYGTLMNGKLEKLADLPYLCDIKDGELVFDYPSGNIRKTKVYSADELESAAEIQSDLR